MDRPTKTFGLSEPMDVWLKLRFDLDRLKAARSTRDLQYAALDCAIWAFHMIDWVLESVDDAAHLRLTGKQRDGKKVLDGFLATNASRLPALPWIGQIANTGKHRVLRNSKDDPSWVTGHTIRFDPPFDARNPHNPVSISAVAYLRMTATAEEMQVQAFFEGVVSQWEHFLKRENLFDWDWDAPLTLMRSLSKRWIAFLAIRRTLPEYTSASASTASRFTASMTARLIRPRLGFGALSALSTSRISSTRSTAACMAS